MIKDVTAESLVAFAIKTEELGAQLYQGLARRFAADIELRELFEQLERDEVDHVGQIRAMAERLGPRFRDRPISVEEQTYLRAMSMSEIFYRPRGPAVDIATVRNREDALKRALELEKTTLAYYQAVRDVAGSEEVLDSLIAMERMHVAKVMTRLLAETMLRGLADSA